MSENKKFMVEFGDSHTIIEAERMEDAAVEVLKVIMKAYPRKEWTFAKDIRVMEVVGKMETYLTSDVQKSAADDLYREVAKKNTGESDNGK